MERIRLVRVERLAASLKRGSGSYRCRSPKSAALYIPPVLLSFWRPASAGRTPTVFTLRRSILSIALVFVAAPVFAQVVQQSLRLLNVQPDIEVDDRPSNGRASSQSASDPYLDRFEVRLDAGPVSEELPHSIFTLRPLRVFVVEHRTAGQRVEITDMAHGLGVDTDPRRTRREQGQPSCVRRVPRARGCAAAIVHRSGTNRARERADLDDGRVARDLVAVVHRTSVRRSPRSAMRQPLLTSPQYLRLPRVMPRRHD